MAVDNTISKYLKFGNVYTEIPASATPEKAFTPGVYVFKVNPRTDEASMTRIADSLRVPKEVFGTAVEDSRRYLNTYEDRRASGRNTGILSHGPKGSGKTLINNIIGNDVIARGGIVIQVTAVIPMDRLVGMLSGFQGPVSIYFDEFEKVYSEEEDQYTLLNAMSGGLLSGALFQFMVNYIDRVNGLFKDRPDRVFYTLPFDRLDPNFVRQYTEVALRNKQWVDDVVFLSKVYTSFTADVMCSLVEESNRYNEHPFVALIKMGLIKNHHVYTAHIVVGPESTDVTDSFYGSRIFHDPMLYDPAATIVSGVCFSDRRSVEIKKAIEDAGGDPKAFTDTRIRFEICADSFLREDESRCLYFKTSCTEINIQLKPDNGSIIARLTERRPEVFVL